MVHFFRIQLRSISPFNVAGMPSGSVADLFARAASEHLGLHMPCIIAAENRVLGKRSMCQLLNLAVIHFFTAVFDNEDAL